MKTKFKNTIIRFIGLFYKQFTFKSSYSVKRLFLIFFLQKIIGINRQVPWFVHHSSFVKSFDKIEKGTKNPGIAPGIYIDGRSGIVFGQNVWLGPNVSVISKNHDFTKYTEYTESPPIKIGKNSLLLAGCTILPGVELGNHVIVAAGAVVTKSFTEDDILIGGIPAKIIKKIEPYQEN